MESTTTTKSDQITLPPIPNAVSTNASASTTSTAVMDAQQGATSVIDDGNGTDGALIGGIIGGIVAVVVLVAVAVFIVARNRRRGQTATQTTTTHSTTQTQTQLGQDSDNTARNQYNTIPRSGQYYSGRIEPPRARATTQQYSDSGRIQQAPGTVTYDAFAPNEVTR
jgi:hypothetical protein